MVCHLFDVKPLPEPLLTNIQISRVAVTSTVKSYQINSFSNGHQVAITETIYLVPFQLTPGGILIQTAPIKYSSAR